MDIIVSVKSSCFYRNNKYICQQIPLCKWLNVHLTIHSFLFQACILDCVSSPSFKGDIVITKSRRWHLPLCLGHKRANKKNIWTTPFLYSHLPLELKRLQVFGGMNYKLGSVLSQKAIPSTSTHYINKSQLSTVLTSIALLLFITFTQSWPTEFQKCCFKKKHGLLLG